MFRKRRAQDMLEQKKKSLNTYTAKGLRETKDKNDKVIKNFRALLAD